MPKESSGGSAATELSEVAVKPTGWAPAAVITAKGATETDAAKAALGLPVRGLMVLAIGANSHFVKDQLVQGDIVTAIWHQPVTAEGVRLISLGLPMPSVTVVGQPGGPPAGSGLFDLPALDYVEPGESSDPDFLERVRMRATPFSIGEGETMTLDLKLSTSS